ncbi:hypothetical protein, partial [Streptomyces mirabilis]|uniref:hypothetical protein n=1 Tax=Streptomyces mirabilis TaxID=68239 RepID=UPI003655C796
MSVVAQSRPRPVAPYGIGLPTFRVLPPVFPVPFGAGPPPRGARRRAFRGLPTTWAQGPARPRAGGAGGP